MNLDGKKALIFDCDGTLADTMNAHKQAYKLACIANEHSFDSVIFDMYAPYGGDVLMEELAPYYLRETVIKDKQKLLPYCLEKFMVPNLELISLIKHEYGKRKIIVVSNGRRASILKIIEELGIRKEVSMVFTKEDTVRAKPHPDPYLNALTQFNLKPEEVVVFEDNEIGIESATTAGIKDIVEVKVNGKF